MTTGTCRAVVSKSYGLPHLVCLLATLLSLASTRAAGPSRPASGPAVIGPIVGRANEPPPTAEQTARQYVAFLTGEDPSRRDWAAGQLAALGEPALGPLADAAKGAKADGAGDDVRQLITLTADRIRADKSGREVLTPFLAKHHVGGGGGAGGAPGQPAGPGEVLPVVDAGLHQAFPGYLFYVLRFRQFPVAREVPEGFRPSNVLAVRSAGDRAPGDGVPAKDGGAAAGEAVERLDDAGAAERFFRAHLAPVTDEAAAK